MSTYATTEALLAQLAHLDAAPKDTGTVDLVVRRPAIGAREIMAEAELSLDCGMVGDTWAMRPSSRTGDGTPHPEMKLNVMSSRMISLLAATDDERALAGDQLYVDLDLSHESLPVGSRLIIGDPASGPLSGAIIEVTAQPHTGCAKFIERFGEDAMRFVNGRQGRPRRLRGLNAIVVTAGTVRPGDTVVVERPE